MIQSQLRWLWGLVPLQKEENVKDLEKQGCTHFGNFFFFHSTQGVLSLAEIYSC